MLRVARSLRCLVDIQTQPLQMKGEIVRCGTLKKKMVKVVQLVTVLKKLLSPVDPPKYYGMELATCMPLLKKLTLPQAILVRQRVTVNFDKDVNMTRLCRNLFEPYCVLFQEVVRGYTAAEVPTLCTYELLTSRTLQ